MLFNLCISISNVFYIGISDKIHTTTLISPDQNKFSANNNKNSAIRKETGWQNKRT